MADYCCPDCDGRLRDAGIANAHRCLRCGQLILEAIDGTHQRVSEFYRRATGHWWGGVR